MARRSTSDGKVAERKEADDGLLYGYDRGGRPCWDSTTPERVVLVRDLRAYGPGLHIGQLGWTIAGTTTGYDTVAVAFDTGRRLNVVLKYGSCPIERVVPERAEEVSRRLVGQYRGSRFDADPSMAQQRLTEWLDRTYSGFVSFANEVIAGEGDEAVYAYTFPSLRDLAALRGEGGYPVKVGCARGAEGGAIGRIRSQIAERAAYPERPVVLLIRRTWAARGLEKRLHRRLRDLGRKVPDALGREWFQTSAPELVQLLSELPVEGFDPEKPVCGVGEVLEDIVPAAGEGSVLTGE